MILQKIVASRGEKIRALEAPRRSLFKALAQKGISLIGEIKRASPSEGVIAPSWNPEGLLQSYLVWRDPGSFGGDGATFFSGGSTVADPA